MLYINVSLAIISIAVIPILLFITRLVAKRLANMLKVTMVKLQKLVQSFKIILRGLGQSQLMG